MHDLNVKAQFPGGTHDSHILKESGVGCHIATASYEGLFVGDTGYPLRPYLMINTCREQLQCTKTRFKSKNVLGIMKNRHCCLHAGVRCSVERAIRVTVACCILHNFALMCNDQSGDLRAQDIRGRNGRRLPLVPNNDLCGSEILSTPRRMPQD